MLSAFASPFNTPSSLADPLLPLRAAARQAVEIYQQEPMVTPDKFDLAQLLKSPYQSPDQQGETGLAKRKLITEQMSNLRKFYALASDDDTTIAALAEWPTLYLLLTEAIEPLRRAFGQKKLLQLDALNFDDEEGSILRVLVRLPSDTPRPAELMQRFQEEWWLKNCSRSQASLVFDYETGNGF